MVLLIKYFSIDYYNPALEILYFITEFIASKEL